MDAEEIRLKEAAEAEARAQDVRRVEAENRALKKCKANHRGLQAEELYNSNRAMFRRCYNNQRGLIENVLEETSRRTCPDCLVKMVFYKIKWQNCTVEYAPFWGPGICEIEEGDLPDLDWKDFIERREKERLAQIEAKLPSFVEDVVRKRTRRGGKHRIKGVKIVNEGNEVRLEEEEEDSGPRGGSGSPAATPGGGSSLGGGVCSLGGGVGGGNSPGGGGGTPSRSASPGLVMALTPDPAALADPVGALAIAPKAAPTKLGGGQGQKSAYSCFWAAQKGYLTQSKAFQLWENMSDLERQPWHKLADGQGTSSSSSASAQRPWTRSVTKMLK